MEEKRLQPVNLESYKPLRELVLMPFARRLLTEPLNPGKADGNSIGRGIGSIRTPSAKHCKLELEGL